MSVQISVRVTPRSARPGIGGWRTGTNGREELEVRVSAAPSEGAANDAVVRLLASELDLPRSGIRIVSGSNSRHKRVSLPIDADEAKRRLAAAKRA